MILWCQSQLDRNAWQRAYDDNGDGWVFQEARRRKTEWVITRNSDHVIIAQSKGATIGSFLNAEEIA